MYTSDEAGHTCASAVAGPAVGPTDLPERYMTALDAHSCATKFLESVADI